MKQIIVSLLLVVLISSCNNSNKEAKQDDTQNGTEQNKNTGNDMDDGIIGDANDKENFISSCMIDAGTWAGLDAGRKKIFCECVWEKSKGNYPGQTITDTMKLKADEKLKDCLQKVQN